MTEIIGVRFKAGGKQYYFDPQGVAVRPGQGVVLSTSRGQEFALCSRGNGFVEDTAVVQPLRPMLRLATPRDLELVENNHKKEAEAYKICQQKIADHKLDMKLVEVEYSFEGNKILFFFTAENRVDFRGLVKDLAAIFHARIELRQIGVRDEAKLLGGLGICGKPFCCSQFLDEFQPVSIKMAKTQSLSLNPVKISGTCGRLMCCLKYEQHAYEDAVKRCPKQDSFVETPDGAGTVLHVNLLREKVKVRIEDSTEQPKLYFNSEVNVVRNGKGKRPEGYVVPPKAELEARRFVPKEEAAPAGGPPKTALSSALEDIFSATDAPERVRPPVRQSRPTGGKPAVSRPPVSGKPAGGDPRPGGGKPSRPAGSEPRPNGGRTGGRPGGNQGVRRPAPKPQPPEQEQPAIKPEKPETNPRSRNRRWRGKPKRDGGPQA